MLAGWTDFDGKVNYRLRGESVIERLPSKARDLLADLSIDARDLSGLKIEGAIDDPDVTLGGVPLSLTPAGGRGDAARAGRRPPAAPRAGTPAPRTNLALR